jgi:hypothetical protein
MNFCSLLDQLHEKMGLQRNVAMFNDWDITYLYTHTHTHTHIHIYFPNREME